MHYTEQLKKLKKKKEQSCKTVKAVQLDNSIDFIWP